MQEKPLVNRVAQSGLIVINLGDYFPGEDIVAFDLADYLFKGFVLKEKDFREALANFDWTNLEGKNLAIFCSTDAILPLWSFMLVTTYAEPYAKEIYQGNKEEFLKFHYQKTIQQLDIDKFDNQRVIIKGCSDKPVPAFAYNELTKKLRPVVKSLMFGEPCSTVPIFKKKA
ncbi:MAG: DUF2480 family protein [Saprospiraceae bacterium]|nr:DUF2480 family protein [Saprospiraceae bacterium]